MTWNQAERGTNCESLQWLRCLCSIDLSHGSHNHSEALIASYHDYWLKYEGGLLVPWREVVYSRWGRWSSSRWPTLWPWASSWFDFLKKNKKHGGPFPTTLLANLSSCWRIHVIINLLQACQGTKPWAEAKRFHYSLYSGAAGCLADWLQLAAVCVGRSHQKPHISPESGAFVFVPCGLLWYNAAVAALSVFVPMLGMKQPRVRAHFRFLYNKYLYRLQHPDYET